jgi:two-component system NarL family response regulator
LGLIVAGRSNKEIAHELQIGEESVKTHSKSLFSKLGVADRTQAAIEAIRHGIVHL